MKIQISLSIQLLFLSATISVFTEPVPVVVELFTSSKDCPDCPAVEQVLLNLQTEVSEQQMIPLVYHLEDSLSTNVGTDRAEGYYLVSQPPAVILNGTAAALETGENLESSLRDQITALLSSRTSPWMIRGNLVVQGNTITSTVRLISPVIPEEFLVLHFVLLETIPGQYSNVVREFVTATFVSDSAVSEGVEVEIQPASPDSVLHGVWLVQDFGSREIIQAKVVSSPLPPYVDLDANGVFNPLDLYIFSRFWHISSPLVDSNGDLRVDAADLVDFSSYHR
ncbi:MAG: hypothetical protein ACOX5R_05285 [bacterium]|jgi:thiol-disulfide isomerase/thioredoxin